ncbi:acyltransferase family protein [aff. Roholtiella sp. LEGE 12411]|uniref:acyltransferase family protein n=1 Tax=aff. Roholtiella sp. LEGE 12411 TaxID=1828822 RepID=UPI00188008BB|nr:acyltransferase [aff. Roholtiella sp. LEGE 12411]MBE9033636.1 acyltransferase [aff. Roholtiella sp. LEGE 12411]
MGLIRVLLALTVVVAHSNAIFGIEFGGGVVAVQTFFIISGFYMSMILENKYIGEGSYKLFISNRLLRLFPIYWVVLALTIIINLFAIFLINKPVTLSYYIDYFHEMSLGTFLFTVIMNIMLFGQDIIMFLGLNTETGNLFFTNNYFETDPQLWRFSFIPQAWTLGVELTFYLIAPFIVRRKTSTILTLILLSLLLRGYIYFSLGWTNDPWIHRFFPTELALFLFGTISYRIYSKIANSKKSGKIELSITVGFIIITIFYQFIPAFSNIWIYYLLSCFSIPFIFKVTKNSKFDMHLGEFSYPIYIGHRIVIQAITPFTDKLGIETYRGELATILSFGTAYLLIKFVSDPIEKIRRARFEKAKKTMSTNQSN